MRTIVRDRCMSDFESCSIFIAVARIDLTSDSSADEEEDNSFLVARCSKEFADGDFDCRCVISFTSKDPGEDDLIIARDGSWTS